jgi:Tol biopolymer transport system component
MTQTGGSQTNITNTPGFDVTPAWSSDGTKIAFASNRPPGGGLDFNIFTMSATGGAQAPLVTDSAADVFPDW